MSIEKHTTASARFRSVRLSKDDLRRIERALGAEEVTWQISSREQPGTWSWKQVTTQSKSLEELAENAPKGRIYDFGVRATIGKQLITLSLEGPSNRFITLSYDGPGNGVSDAFHRASSLLKSAEKSGRRWHYAGAAAWMVAISVPLSILDQVGKLGIFYDQPGPVGNVAKATGSAVGAFLILATILGGFASWAMASSVALRPLIDTSSLVRRTLHGIADAAKWVASVHKSDHLNKQIMLLATVIAAICGAGSFAVAVWEQLFAAK